MLNLELWRVRFREHLELRQCAARTVESYAGELRPLFAWLEGQGVEEPGAVTRDHLEGYRTHLFYLRTKAGEALSLQTQQARLTSVKAFFRFLLIDQYVLVDPAAALALPRVPRALPRALLTEGDVQNLLEAPDTATPLGLRDRAMLEVLYVTGIRNLELRGLRLDDVGLERAELRIARGKGNKSRMVPLGDEAVLWLDHFLREGRPQLVRDAAVRAVFLTWRGRPLTRETVAEIVLRCAVRAGLPPVTPHQLRHCCATHMLRHGAGLRHLQELLGHASATTTQRYTRVELSDLRRVLRRCHPRERGRR